VEGEKLRVELEEFKRSQNVQKGEKMQIEPKNPIYQQCKRYQAIRAELEDLPNKKKAELEKVRAETSENALSSNNRVVGISSKSMSPRKQ
jgi:hypothetical protein